MDNTFDQLADHYMNQVDEKAWNAHYERPAVLDLVPEDMQGLRVLDAGCATGWYSQEFLKRGAQVLALDSSQEMVRLAGQRLAGRARVYRQDLAEPLDFIGDQELDLIVASLSLHYLEDWGPSLAEFNRILKKGGALIISTHHPIMELREFPCQDYFSRERLRDSWTIDGKSVEVSFYRRPLSSIINSLIGANFIIDYLGEPRPSLAFKEYSEEKYNYLCRNPHFLLIKTIKGDM